MTDVELSLEAALRHARNDDREAVLASLLEAWRIGRAPKIAEIVALVSRQLTKRLPPLRGTNRKTTVEAVWQTAARSHGSAGVERLLEGVSEVRFLADRIRTLLELPPDPRLSAWAVWRLQHPPWDYYNRIPLFDGLVALLDHAMDPRVLPSLERLLTTRSRDWSVSEDRWGTLRAHHDALRARPVLPISEESAEVLDELRAHLLREPSSPAPFFESVYAEPEDDAARAVLGDLLQQRDDPRGELIALQLERARTGRRPTSREVQLVRTWGRDWRGPLAPALEDVVFERGFPARGRWRGGRAAEATAGLSAWATVSHLDMNGFDQSSLLLAPCMRSLRHVTGLAPENLHRLHDEGPRPWLSLGVRPSSSRRLVAQLTAAEEIFPALRRLVLASRSLPLDIEALDLAHLLAPWPALEELDTELTPDELAPLLLLPATSGLRLITTRHGTARFFFDRARKRLTVRGSCGDGWVVGYLFGFGPLREAGLVDAVDFHFSSRSLLHEENFTERILAGGRQSGLTVMAFGRAL